MATLVIMPRQGQSVESCVITSFNKNIGDKVEKGDILFSYETDKSSFDEQAPEAGTVLAIFREEGEDVPCLENVLVIGNEGEDISEFIPKANVEENKTDESDSASVKAALNEELPKEVITEACASQGGFAISPRARLLAEKTHADLKKAVGTGPNGRIIERDVQKLVDLGFTVSPAASEDYTKATEGSGISGKVMTRDLCESNNNDKIEEFNTISEAEYEDVKLSGVRKVIAKSMHASISTMAQLTHNASFDATKILALRASLKANAEALGIGNITLNDMVLYAVSRVLKDHRDMNAHYLDDVIRYFNSVNLGVAVDTKRGLLVPTVFGADRLSLNELSRAAKTVIAEAQEGTINPDKLKGGTFTVTNLGSLGVESFTPIINPPQTGILGVCNITKRIKEVNGEDKIYPAMGLSLTFDHRAVDGAPAARFLKDLCHALENFDLLLTK